MLLEYSVYTVYEAVIEREAVGRSRFGQQTQDMWNVRIQRSSDCLSIRPFGLALTFSQNPDEVDVAALTVLIREAEVLRRRKYKCGKEPSAWTHLVDQAYAFWQPKEQGAPLERWEKTEKKIVGVSEAIRRLSA